MFCRKYLPSHENKQSSSLSVTSLSFDFKDGHNKASTLSQVLHLEISLRPLSWMALPKLDTSPDDGALIVETHSQNTR